MLDTAPTEERSRRGRRFSRIRDFLPLFFFAAGTILLYSIQLSVRPLHHDEAVNHHFVHEMFQRGYYPYSHENYHGPLFFYLLAWSVKLLGDSEIGLRALPLASGVFLVLIPLLYRGTIGKTNAYLAALLLTLSPSLLFYSRYTIHEVLFVAFQILLAISIFSWATSGRRQQWYVIWLSLAALIALKETFVVSVFWIAVGLTFVLSPKKLFDRFVTARSEVTKGYLIFIIALFFVFTGGFRWFEGLREMVQAFPQWVGRGTSSDYGHFKPWFYYVRSVLAPTEPVLLVTTGLLSLIALRDLVIWVGRRGVSLLSSWQRFLFVWSTGTLITYSLIPYKTPWLIICYVAPATLLVGSLLAAGISRGGVFRSTTIAVLLILCFWHLRSSVTYSYRAPKQIDQLFFTERVSFGDRNPYCYVHTSEGMLELVEEIKRYLVHTPNARILIGVDGYWPLPFYLRNVTDRAAYMRVEDPASVAENYDIIVADHTTTWDDPSFDRKYYRLTGASESHTYIRRVPAGEGK